jgi:hypothetical protein
MKYNVLSGAGYASIGAVDIKEVIEIAGIIVFYGYLKFH